MRSNLVPFCDHALYNRHIISGSNVPVVLSVDEESSMNAIACKLVENLASVDVWAIIKGKSNGPWHCAARDDCSVGDRRGGLSLGFD